MAAGTVTLTFSDSADITNLLNAMESNYNFAKNGGGLTGGQFALNQMVAWFQSQFAQYNQMLASQAASAASAAALAGQTTISLVPYEAVGLGGTITASSP